MLVCRDRNSQNPRQRRLSVFWSRYKTQYRGEVWRGALQVFWVPPRLDWGWWPEGCGEPPGARWVGRIHAATWTGRAREFHWFWTPGSLEVYLRTPSYWSRSWVIGIRKS